MTILPDLASELYHEDRLPDVASPALSASIAHTLVSQSPRHAWEKHPRLNPHWQRDEDSRFDIGRVAHSVLLEGEDIVWVVHEDSWRTNFAKEAREHGRSLGKVPLLAKDRDSVMAMVEAVRAQLADHRADPPLFDSGASEVTLLWDEDGIACKARVDWLRADLAAIDDLKTRSQEGGASVERWKKALYLHGAHLQAYMYVRAVERATGVTPAFRWCCVETSPPYALSVSEPGADVLAVGQSDFEYALGVWRECLERDEWPAYPNTVARIDAPGWEVEKRVMREEVAA